MASRGGKVDDARLLKVLFTSQVLTGRIVVALRRVSRPCPRYSNCCSRYDGLSPSLSGRSGLLGAAAIQPVSAISSARSHRTSIPAPLPRFPPCPRFPPVRSRNHGFHRLASDSLL